jgi:hypothetical protein
MFRNLSEGNSWGMRTYDYKKTPLSFWGIL